MVGILADEFDVTLAVGFLDVFHRDVLFAVDVDRQQVHVAPEYVVDVAQLLVQHDVAAFEQRIHRVAHYIYRAVAFRQVGDVDEVYGFGLRLIREQRHQSRRSLDRVERHALQRQRIVRAESVGRQVGFGVEHVAFAALQPFGVYVQFLNQYVAVPGREPGFPRFDHRKGRFADAKMLSQLFLRHAQLFSYQFYPRVHSF